MTLSAQIMKKGRGLTEKHITGGGSSCTKLGIISQQSQHFFVKKTVVHFIFSVNHNTSTVNNESLCTP